MIQIAHTPNSLLPTDGADRPYIEDLTSGLFPGHFGFQIGGHTVGPNVVIAGGTGLTRQVYQRLLLLPSLSRLKGKLFLVDLDRLGGPDGIDGIRHLLPDQAAIDGQLFLPFVAVDGMWGDDRHLAVKEAYWTVLRLCAGLGMITGRGIPDLTKTAPENYNWRSTRHRRRLN